MPPGIPITHGRLRMRSLVTLTLLATLAWCTPAQAQNFKEKIKFPTNPIVLGGEISPSMAVTFNHSSHRDVACDTCHHKPRCAICHYSPSEEKSPYASCSAAEGCHTIQGRSSEPESRFMAFHSRESMRSCFGCHRSLSQEHPEFQGCRPCHPQNPANEEK